MAERPRVTILGPNPLVSVTIEMRGRDDDIHMHAAGQGVWVARMAAELGAWPILCGLVGGETGVLLRTLMQTLEGELRAICSAGTTGGYVVDRRETPTRKLLAAHLAPPPSRHEVDDLVAAAIAAALGSELLVLCNPYPVLGFPEDAYDTIAASARANDIPVLADLSSPRVDRVLPHAPALVKLNDWELAEYVSGPVDGPRALRAAQRMIDSGAQAVAVTRAEAPILVLPGAEAPYEIEPPRLADGFREGCGDSMMGAVAAAWASGAPLRDALVLGAAAGSGNFLRHGLGTGHRSIVEEFAARVRVRELDVGTTKRAVGSSPRPRSPGGPPGRSTPGAAHSGRRRRGPERRG